MYSGIWEKERAKESQNDRQLKRITVKKKGKSKKVKEEKKD